MRVRVRITLGAHFETDHVRAGPCQEKRQAAGAGADVEHPVSRSEVDPTDYGGVDRHEPCGVQETMEAVGPHHAAPRAHDLVPVVLAVCALLTGPVVPTMRGVPLTAHASDGRGDGGAAPGTNGPRRVDARL